MLAQAPRGTILPSLKNAKNLMVAIPNPKLLKHSQKNTLINLFLNSAKINSQSRVKAKTLHYALALFNICQMKNPYVEE